MENKLLFAPENSRVSAVLAPSKDNPRNSEGDFIRLKDGRILYAFSYYHGEDGGDHARCDIRCLWSDDEGESFHTGENDGGKPHLLISAEPYGEKNVMSASLLRMQNGDVGLFYILKHGDMTDEILLSRSNDECETFYETTQVLPGKWKGYYVLNNSRIEQLSDGRILVPVAQHHTTYSETAEYDGRSSIWFFSSSDDGRTWARMPARIDPPELAYSSTGLQEPGVSEMPNGVLYAYARTSMGRHYEAISPDGGAHWFGPQPSRFTGPESPLEIRRNPYSGIYYAMWNPIPNYLGREQKPGMWGRTPLALAASRDGYNFDLADMQLIENDPDCGYSYPAMYFLDEHTMLTAYCSGRPEDGCNLFRVTIRKIILN